MGKRGIGGEGKILPHPTPGICKDVKGKGLREKGFVSD
jgi:hypothetical protein